MKYLIKAHEGTIDIATDGDEKQIPKKTMAKLLKMHAHFIGRLMRLTGGDGKTARAIRSALEIAYLAVLSGQSPAGEEPYFAKEPVSVIYDLDQNRTFFAADQDGGIPKNPVGGLLLIFTRLSGVLAGDIDYVFFMSELAAEYDNGIQEMGKEEKNGKISG